MSIKKRPFTVEQVHDIAVKAFDAGLHVGKKLNRIYREYTRVSSRRHSNSESESESENIFREMKASAKRHHKHHD